MRITPSKAEQGYTILHDCHGALSETGPLLIETTILGVLCKFKLRYERRSKSFVKNGRGME